MYANGVWFRIDVANGVISEGCYLREKEREERRRCVGGQLIGDNILILR